MSPTGVTPILLHVEIMSNGFFDLGNLFFWGGGAQHLEVQPLGSYFPGLASLPARPEKDLPPVRIHPWMEYVARTPGATFSHWLRELSRGSIDDDHSA